MKLCCVDPRIHWYCLMKNTQCIDFLRSAHTNTHIYWCIMYCSSRTAQSWWPEHAHGWALPLPCEVRGNLFWCGSVSRPLKVREGQMKWLAVLLKQEAMLSINPFLPLTEHTQLSQVLQTTREGVQIEIAVKSSKMLLYLRHLFLVKCVFYGLVY